MLKLMSNILFKYGQPDPDDEPATDSPAGPSSPNSRPAEVKFIDFQSARFTSLATDLVYFIFTSVRVRRCFYGGTVQGDQAACPKPPVDIDAKVAFKY